MAKFSHVDDQGRAKMVDVGMKKPQLRTAKARGCIRMAKKTAQLIAENKMKKGDVLTVAEVAGINAAKRAFELIPLCHPLSITNVNVNAVLENNAVSVTSEVSCVGRTGIEMESLTAVSVALLTIYDMCKAVDKQMEIGEITLVEKKKTDIPPTAPPPVKTEEKQYECARGKVVSVNVSLEKGAPKAPVPAIVVNENGVTGDAHSGPWHRQVSLLAQETIDAFTEKTGRPTAPGEFAENITTRGLALDKVAVLDKIEIGDVKLEVTQIGKKCHGDTCSIFREVGQCAMPKEGIFCRVLSGGKIASGDIAVHLARPLCFRIITLSDRASRGDYEDRSGPRIQDLVEEFFSGKRWRIEIERAILPDEPEPLREELLTARAGGIDVVITTGGTGIGPRDITPEVVVSLADKIIPGIMEHIRRTFGSEKPNALLSRSVAVAMGRTLVYALPGSTRAVEEYTGEILKTLEHLITTMHGLDTH